MEVHPHLGHVRGTLRRWFSARVPTRLLAGGGKGLWRTHNSRDMSQRLVTSSASAADSATSVRAVSRVRLCYFVTWMVTSAKPPDVTCAVIVVVAGLFFAGVTVSWFVWLPPTPIVTGDRRNRVVVRAALVRVIERAEAAVAMFP